MHIAEETDRYDDHSDRYTRSDNVNSSMAVDEASSIVFFDTLARFRIERQM
jgi:hypothetical protein